MIHFTNLFKILSPNNTKLRYLSVLRLFNKKKEKPPPSHYEFMRAQPEDSENILQLMKESYFKEEPTFASVKVKNTAVFLENARRSLEEGLTYIAKCKYNGCIVGACINSATNPWDADRKERYGCTAKDCETRKLFLFYAFIQRAPNLYECFNVQKIYEIEYLFVHPQHRYRGLARKLMDLSKQLGRDCGYKIIRCDATNEYTALICERLNMRKIFEIPYCAYMGQNMKPVFTPMPPHRACKIYIFNSNDNCRK